MLILSIAFEIRKSNRHNWRGGKKEERKKERRITGNKKNIKVKNKKSHHYMMTFNKNTLTQLIELRYRNTPVPALLKQMFTQHYCPLAVQWLTLLHIFQLETRIQLSSNCKQIMIDGQLKTYAYFESAFPNHPWNDRNNISKHYDITCHVWTEI